MDNRRVFTVVAPELTEENIENIPTVHDGQHLELYYNIIFADLGFTLPDHLRPVTIALGDKNIQSLMVIISPGAGKSQLLDIAYPTWELGHNQNLTILGVSGGAELIMGFLQASMTIIDKNPVYNTLFPGTIPDKEQGWSTSRGAFVKRTAIGQPDPSYAATGYGCYSDDTEVLTKRGWLLFKDTNKDDWFATRNPITKEFEWQQSTKYIQKYYNGEMIHFYGLSLDLLVTPNHRMITYNYHKNSNEKIITAENVYNYSYNSLRLPSTSKWKGEEIKEKFFGSTNNRIRTALEQKEFIIQQSKSGQSYRKIASLVGISNSQIHKIITGKTTYSNPTYWARDVEMSGDDYCAFMGMYLSEGSINSNFVQITQFKQSKGFQPYKELLNRIFRTEVYYSDHSNQFIIGSVNLCNYLHQFGDCYKKFIPEGILGATPRQLQIFWDYYLLGDGWKTQSAGQEGISTSSKNMADDLQEVAQKIGYSSSVRVRISKDRMINNHFTRGGKRYYEVSLTRSKYKSFHKEKIDYSGEVFCVSVPNGTLYTKRRGKTIWCGNSKSITGKHARLLVIDDIHDEENSATSEQIEKVENFYYKTLLGRQDPQGARMVIIGRRWATDDLYGRLKESKDWLVMTLAAIRDTAELYYDVRIPAGLSCVFNNYTPSKDVEDIRVVYGNNTDNLGFYWNDIRMSSKYKEAILNKKNKPAIFETVYQSNPSAAESKPFNEADFPDFSIPAELEIGRNYDTVANYLAKMDFEMIIQSWDTAYTAKAVNDPSVGYTLGLRGCELNHRAVGNDDNVVPFHYDIYVLDELYRRVDYGELQQEVLDYYYKWNPNYVIMENATAGIPLMGALAAYSIQVIGVTVQHTSKLTRATDGAKAGSVQGWAKQGRIWIPRKASWAAGLLNELKDFTGARNKKDDRVDSLIHGVNWAIDYGIQNRELPEGWRNKEDIENKIKSWAVVNHPLMDLPNLYHNVQNPYYGLCGSCKSFDASKSWCNLHKHVTVKIGTCQMYDPKEGEEQVLKIVYGEQTDTTKS